MALENVLGKISKLRTYQHGERRAPHKPLLLLFAIGQRMRAKDSLPYPAVRNALLPLLNAYARPVQNQHQPELPYWYLRSDKLWQVEGAEGLPLTLGGFPRRDALRRTSGRLDDEVQQIIATDPDGTRVVVKRILDEHFPSALHEDILAAVGINLLPENSVIDAPDAAVGMRSRDPRFRANVLRAYEYQCAATGFRAALGGSYFGCEAAHVRWHSYEGPDDVANGIALEPTLHKLFDAGAWTLTDDRRILVSQQFTGSEQAVNKLRGLHGKYLRSPLDGEPKVALEFIRWHREAGLGGVFRLPALDL